nr:hypothetical protein [Tanacetum cinerariifolium]
MQKIFKEQVKEQVKVQVSKILPRIEQTVNEQLEAEVLTRSSHSSKTSYAVAANLSEMELKKILIEKMKCNKSIQRSDEQRNLYKALVEAYESDKIILDTYGETVTLKRRRDDDVDKDKKPSAGPDRGSKRRREGKEPESASAPKEKATTCNWAIGRPKAKMSLMHARSEGDISMFCDTDDAHGNENVYMFQEREVRDRIVIRLEGDLCEIQSLQKTVNLLIQDICVEYQY